MTKFERALLVLVFLGLVGPRVADAAMTRTKSQGQLALEEARPPIPDTGAPVRMQCTTGTDADSGALDPWESYIIQCDTDAWVRWGTAAVNAVANDFKVVSGIPHSFSTDTSTLHVSCLSVVTTADCRILKTH